MQLYIEYVILDNCVIDYMILKLIDISTGQKIKKLNKVLVCGLGTIFAVFMPFLHDQKLALFFYRIFTSLILVMCLKKYKKTTNFLTYYCLFFAYTFLLGGAMLGLIEWMGINYSMSGLYLYTFEFPLSVFALIFILFFRLITSFVKIIRTKLSRANYFYPITIYCKGKKFETFAFFDSGNNVSFGESGVNIISINLFLKLYKDIDLQKVLTRKIEKDKLKNIEYISISGIGEGCKFLSFEIDCLEVCGQIFKDTRLAVAMKNFGDYDCILHRDYVKG